MLVILATSIQGQYCFGAGRQMQVGVGTHVGNNLAAVQNILDNLDLSFRDDFRWSNMETQKGVLTYANVNKNLDALIADALKRHKQPIILLSNGNKLYDGGGQISSAEGLAAYARYAQFVAKHMGNNVLQYEVWNEWPGGSGWTQQQPSSKGDPVAYANLLRATYPAIKAANPKAVVIGGGMGYPDIGWLTKFADAGGLAAIDGISIHPYVHCNAHSPLPPSNTRVGSNLASRQSRLGVTRVADSSTYIPIGGTAEQSIAYVDSLKSFVDKHAPGRNMSVYVTEIGWPTMTGQCGIPDTQAAAYLQRFMLLALARPYVAGVWWYDLQDDGTDPANREFHFGLTAHDFSPKPAYTALTGLMEILGSTSAINESLGQSGEITISGKTSAGKSFVAAWVPTVNFNSEQSWAAGPKLATSGLRAMTTSTNTTDSSHIGATPSIFISE